MEAVYVEDLTVSLDGEVILEGVSFALKHPSAMCIVGPNGAGQTTLLKVLLGLVRPSYGVVRVFGVDPIKNPLKVRGFIGYVPQRDLIDPTLPILVRDVVLMGRARGGAGGFTEEDYRAAKKALEAVGLLEAWDEPFAHLSGGQQQRVLVARALAREPRLLLLDEPLSGVDPETAGHIVELLNQLKRSITVIVVTHDRPLVRRLADVVLVLNRKPLFVGPPSKWVEVAFGWSGAG